MNTETDSSVNYNELFDNELLNLTRSGHPQAFSVIVDRYRNRLYGTALAMLDSHSAAEQALKNAIDHAYKNLHRYKTSDSLLFSWLCKQVIDYVFRHYTMPCKGQPATLRETPLPEE